jgi:hypothetical protein
MIPLTEKEEPCPSLHILNQCHMLGRCDYNHDVELSPRAIQALKNVYSDIPCKSVTKGASPCSPSSLVIKVEGRFTL